MDVKSPSGVLSVLIANKPYLDGLHIAAAFNKVGKLSRSKSEQDKKICYNIARLLLQQLIIKDPKISVRGIAQAIWCLGKIGMPMGQTEMNYFEDQISKNITQIDPQGLSNILYGFAKFRHRNKYIVGLILTHVRKRLPIFNAQDLSNVIWACAKLRVYNRDLFYDISDQLSKKLDTFNGQNLANLLWSVCHLGHKDEFLLQEISQQVKKRADVMNAKDLATVAWGFMIFDYQKDIELFEAIRLRAGMITNDFQGQDLVTLCQALREVGCDPDEELINNIEKILEVDQARFDAKQVQQLKGLLESMQQKNVIEEQVI